jgi:hypothetical protein
MSLVGLESAFPKIERLQNLALDHMVTIALDHMVTITLDHMVTSIGSLFALLSSNSRNIHRIYVYIVIYVQEFLLLLF